MGLPVYQINSNLHAFTHKVGEQRMGYFALWSCALSLEKAIKKYYESSSNEYEEIKSFSKYMKNFDMAEFCESYLVPLLQTENMEFIVDGCQYKTYPENREYFRLGYCTKISECMCKFRRWKQLL